MPGRRPAVDSNFESNVRGLYVIGDLTGAPVVKLAMEQGSTVAEQIALLPDAKATVAGAYDIIVAGAGASGLNAALVAQEKGLRVLVLEKSRIANTIEDFPEGKWVYAEPDARPVKGKLWLDGARKEDLLSRWHAIIRDHGLDVRTEEGVTSIQQSDGHFEVATAKAVYRARRVIVATGQRGNPRKLGAPGEDREQVYHRLYSPRHYEDENILVVGGGNSAVEAAVTLSEKNRVTLSYRGSAFGRVFLENRRKLDDAVNAGRVELKLATEVTGFGDRTYTLSNGEQREYDHAFVLVGAELPGEFLKSLGLRLENDWTGNPLLAGLLAVACVFSLAWFGGSNWIGGLAVAACAGGLIALGCRGSRFAWLGISFLICFTIYSAKSDLWPYRGWGQPLFAFFERPVWFWYTVAYTLVMTVFGLQALKRWGLDRNDRFQIWRYVSLLGFQWVFFFLVPEFLFHWAVEYQWLGELARDPAFAGQAWRSYGLVYAWPLFFYTFFGSPHQVWVVWGAILSFLIIPLLVLFHGKRYCSWICGCGGLAETLGDRWRHLAPKGRDSIRWEWMNGLVLAIAVAVTVMVLAKDVLELFRSRAQAALDWYKLIVDVWLVGVVPVALYPFFGGKIWCRYWCPLAKMMQMMSGLYARLGIGRFAIHANDKCIACGECSRNCQVGIDVMSFALRQEKLDNSNSSCIGCGICVTVCPMDTLSFLPVETVKLVQIQGVPAR
jgi:thioredoxin reductase/polyferredoxin